MVRKKKLVIHWDKFAKEEFRSEIKYYKKLSVQGADNVKKDILEGVAHLKIFPDKHPIEPSLGFPFRFVAVRDFKVIYYLTGNEIRIVDLFNCSQNPKKIPLRVTH